MVVVVVVVVVLSFFCVFCVFIGTLAFTPSASFPFPLRIPFRITLLASGYPSPPQPSPSIHPSLLSPNLFNLFCTPHLRSLSCVISVLDQVPTPPPLFSSPLNPASALFSSPPFPSFPSSALFLRFCHPHHTYLPPRSFSRFLPSCSFSFFLPFFLSFFPHEAFGEILL